MAFRHYIATLVSTISNPLRSFIPAIQKIYLTSVNKSLVLLFVGLAGILCFAFSTSVPPAPTTARKSVLDEYHGITVRDDYRWLENASDPAVEEWTDVQNRRTRAYLDQIPARPVLEKRVAELINKRPASYFDLVYRGGTLFALKLQPPKNQALLVQMNASNFGSERIVVDPNTLNPRGTTAIDWFVPSLDGRLVAVSLSENGSENGTLHVFDVSAGKELADRIPHVQYPTAGGSVAWNAGSTGFYYTRYPREGERKKEDLNFYQQVYFHKIGLPTAADIYSIGKEFPRIAEIFLEGSDDGKYVLATVANGDGGEYAHYLLDPSGKWGAVTQFSDKAKRGRLGRDAALYILSVDGAPNGKVLRIPLDRPTLAQARTVVPQSNAVIDDFLPTNTRLYVADLVGGPSQIRIFDTSGKQRGTVAVLPVSAVTALQRTQGDDLLFSNESYLIWRGWYRHIASSQETVPALVSKPPVDYSDAEVVREFAVSKDGTRVPINIIRRKGTPLDGNNPTRLTGYGGYGISERPYYGTLRRLWLDQGGIIADVNLRGGGEFGEAWHDSGRLTRKQNVFDDFVASAHHLIEAKYTNPSQLAIEGGSNGGLLMGAVLTQHPELFRAVLSYVGIYDMLRVELDPNGEFNTTEFGTVKNADQFQALYAYSPYHHVVDGKVYPAVLFLTGKNDGRVNPMQSRKMTARLQAANSSTNPILLRTSSTAGHGIGTAMSEVIVQQADALAFLFDQLGLSFTQKP